MRDAVLSATSKGTRDRFARKVDEWIYRYNPLFETVRVIANVCSLAVWWGEDELVEKDTFQQILGRWINERDDGRYEPLAKLVEVHRRQVDRLVNEDYRPSLGIVCKVAHVYVTQGIEYRPSRESSLE